ncbi:hypothetical protein NQ318_018711 [Aromia moschata]|uniref:PiggyBac transposable element-derived protein domain-containing protein n=1 Tax=Aromia moschata TaxID=1265417 RepID=A0AAV8ZFW7_9CUCU|nr:hypothetical protein NQ318_018711 [Aromia moschata]
MCTVHLLAASQSVSKQQIQLRAVINNSLPLTRRELSLPPEISVLSDEDSGAEDDDGDINRLFGRQLRAAVEIQQRNNVRINSDTIDQGKDYDIDTQEPLVKEKQTNFVWASGDLQSGGKNFIPPDFSDFADSTPMEAFEMLWDDDIIKLLVDETRKDALFPDPNITYEEIKCAVAILILSGYDVKPARRYYWDSKSDMGNQLWRLMIKGTEFL